MEQSNNNIQLEDILNQVSALQLNKFIAEYAAKNPEFREELITKFSPQKSSETKKDYATAIKSAFAANTLKSGNRYRQWDDFGFDAADVAEDLKSLLDKADYFIKYENYEEAILICTTLIETVPDEWYPNFDYNGDVQVIYDSAIDKLQEMLEQNFLSSERKKALFDWYSREQRNKKHEHVALNADLTVLEQFFADTPEMLQQNIQNIDERIENATKDYERKNAVLDKIRLLQNADMNNEAEKVITQYLIFSEVRKLRVENLVKEKQYEEAISVIHDGIQIAENNRHPGTVADWKDKLLAIYLLQKDKAKIFATAEDLFYNGREVIKYYHILKEHTEREKWAAYLDTLLARHKGNGMFGHPNHVVATIYIEEQYWDRLLQLVEKSELSGLEAYEQYLKPHFPNEMRNLFVQKITVYAERNMGRNHYQYVARILKKLRKYPEGNKVVDKLLAEFRVKYKLRKAMMEELREV